MAGEKKIFKPYFEAVMKILNDHPVADLDAIRVECDQAFFMAPRQNNKIDENYVGGYSPTAIIVTFTADAENRILKGVPVEEAYKIFSKQNMDVDRRRYRAVLETAAKEYLGHGIYS